MKNSCLLGSYWTCNRIIDIIGNNTMTWTLGTIVIVTYQRVDSPGHDEKPHQEVCEGQGHDQPVGRGLEALLQDDASDYQEVAQHGEDRKDGERQKSPVVLQSLGVHQDCRVVRSLHSGSSQGFCKMENTVI